MALTDADCRRAPGGGKREKRYDGHGLYLLVTPGGRKSWHYAYRFRGAAKDLSLGRYPATGLAAARRARVAARGALDEGRDPGAKAEAAEPTGIRFQQLAEAWLASRRPGWGDGHYDRTAARVRSNLILPLGHRVAADITPADCLAAIRAIEARGALDISRRSYQSLVAIFAFGKASGEVSSNPASDLGDALVARPRVRHHPKLASEDIPAFLRRLRDYPGAETRLAIEMVLHTALRTSELRGGRWDEIERDRWRIPAERMKMPTEHHVPLTPATRDILRRARALHPGSPWIFPGRGGSPISENTMIFALYRMGYKDALTIHGLRGTFSTALNESGKWHPDWIEKQLAHEERNKVRGAYNAAEYWPQRVRMMAWWSEHLTKAGYADLV